MFSPPDCLSASRTKQPDQPGNPTLSSAATPPRIRAGNTTPRAPRPALTGAARTSACGHYFEGLYFLGMRILPAVVPIACAGFLLAAGLRSFVPVPLEAVSETTANVSIGD